MEWSRYYEDARTLAKLLTTWSMSLDSPMHRFVVTSGGGPGIMEAANRGAHEAGGKTIGLNIRLPFEQGANPYITEGLQFEFHYFFMRKFWFAYLAKALVVFPGGFGTLDEMFEILTLMQTEKLGEKIQIILYGSEYWDPILNLEPMAEWGAIAPGDCALIKRADTPEQAFELLKAHLTEHHLQPRRRPRPPRSPRPARSDAWRDRVSVTCAALASSRVCSWRVLRVAGERRRRRTTTRLCRGRLGHAAGRAGDQANASRPRASRGSA